MLLLIFCGAILVLNNGVLGVVYSNKGFPPCANISFTDNGSLDMQTMLYDCSQNIPGALLPPSTYLVAGVYAPTKVLNFCILSVRVSSNFYIRFQVAVGLKINNFISVDDLSSQMTMDFYLRMQWYVSFENDAIIVKSMCA